MHNARTLAETAAPGDPSGGLANHKSRRWSSQVSQGNSTVSTQARQQQRNTIVAQSYYTTYSTQDDRRLFSVGLIQP